MEIIGMFVGILLRIALPLMATVGIVLLLQWLDKRWKEEGELTTAMAGLQQGDFMTKIHCWDLRDCSPEARKNCAAAKNPGEPCWDSLRVDGQLQESCSNCAIRKRVMALKPIIS